MTATGVWLILLAHAPTEAQEHVLAGRLERFTPHPVTDTRTLRRMLADVRANGYVVGGTARWGLRAGLARLVCAGARAMSRAFAMPPSHAAGCTRPAPRAERRGPRLEARTQVLCPQRSHSPSGLGPDPGPGCLVSSFPGIRKTPLSSPGARRHDEPGLARDTLNSPSRQPGEPAAPTGTHLR